MNRNVNLFVMTQSSLALVLALMKTLLFIASTKNFVVMVKKIVLKEKMKKIVHQNENVNRIRNVHNFVLPQPVVKMAVLVLMDINYQRTDMRK